MLTVGNESKRPIVSCNRDFIFEAGTPEELRQPYETNRAIVHAMFQRSSEWSPQDFSEAVLRSPIISNILGEPSAVLLHRSAFERFGWFNPHLHMLCDFEFWARVASNTGNAHIPETLAMFRVHETSTSAYHRQTPAGRFRFEMMDPLLILHEFAFNPLYAGLRSVAMNRRPRVKLADEFWKRALVVLWFARRAVGQGTHPDRSLLDEWQAAAQEYPRLSAIPLRARILAKWRALMRTVSLKVRRREAATG
jgi:hypothetical protein